jgi:CHAT domain-containing protein/Tfp pilus assembly protein PilF
MKVVANLARLGTFWLIVALWLVIAAPCPVTAQPSSLDDVRALNDRVITLYGEGRYGEAVALAQKVLSTREKLLGPEHPDVAQALNNLAFLYAQQGRHTDAEPLYRRSLAINEKALGPDHPDGGLALSNLALPRYADAEPLYRRSLAIREKAFGSEHPDVAQGLNNLAARYWAQGRYADAEPLLHRSLAIKEKALAPDHRDVGLAVNNLAFLYVQQGRYADAEPLYRRSLAINEKALGFEHPDVAVGLNNPAQLYEAQGRYADAEPLYRRSLAIREKALGPEHPEVAQVLNDLALLYAQQGNYANAEPLYRRSLAIREKALGTEHPDVAAGLNNLAGLYKDHREGAQSRAPRCVGRTEQPSLSIPTPRSLRRCGAALAPGAGHPREGARSRAPRGDASASQSCRALQSSGRYGDAYPLARRAIAIHEMRGFDPAGQDTAGLASERRLAGGYFRFFLGVASGYVLAAPAQSATITAESFSAAQLASITPADRAVAQLSARAAAGTPELSRAARERQDMISRRNALDKALIQAASRPPADRDSGREQQLRRELDIVEQKLVEIDETLRRDFPKYAEIANPRPLDLTEAQQLLKPDEALISFVVDNKAVCRFIVRRDRAEFREIKIESSALELQIKALRLGLDLSGATLANLPQFDAGKAYDLYKTLFSGSGTLLEGAKRLLLVPDSALTGLPFSVLITRPSNAEGASFDYQKASWLLRDYSISVLPSVGALKSLRVFAANPEVSREPFVGFGDPVLIGTGVTESNRAVQHLAMRGVVADVSEVRQLAPLSETQDELKEIAKALRADVNSVFVRDQATERRVKTMDLSQTRVIAFATHALTAGEFKGYAEPALVLTPPAQGDEIDDGLLAASEVAQLKLNADWIILSACNTAAADGTPGAPGLSGLARAFIYAGARALLVSHWDVDSRMAARLTSETVRLHQSDPKLSKAEALKRAMLAILDDPTLPSQYRHPAFWAPFFIVGEGGDPATSGKQDQLSYIELVDRILRSTS